MGLFKKMQSVEPVYTMEFRDGAKQLVLNRLVKYNKMIENTVEAKSYPVVTRTVKLHNRLVLQPGEYDIHLLHENGATVELEPGRTEDQAYDIVAMGKAHSVRLVEDDSVIRIQTGGPELTNRVIASNILGKTVSLESTKRDMVVAFFAGALIGAIFLAPIVGALISLLY